MTFGLICRLMTNNNTKSNYFCTVIFKDMENNSMNFKIQN